MDDTYPQNMNTDVYERRCNRIKFDINYNTWNNCNAVQRKRCNIVLVHYEISHNLTIGN